MSAATTYLRAHRDDELPPATSHRRRTVVLVIAAAVIAALVLTWLVAFSSVFGVGTVDVRGARVLSAAQVRRAADIADGTPLVRLDTAAITRRVEQLPDVASAQVSTSFPSTVLVAITERRPIGYLRSAGRDKLVDRTGYEYRTVTSAPANLPKLVVAGGNGSAAVRGAVARVARSLSAGLRANVRSIQALDPTSITLVLRHGRLVRWGSADRNADKARIVAVLLQRKGTQVDVTDPDQPFTR